MQITQHGWRLTSAWKREVVQARQAAFREAGADEVPMKAAIDCWFSIFRKALIYRYTPRQSSMLSLDNQTRAPETLGFETPAERFNACVASTGWGHHRNRKPVFPRWGPVFYKGDSQAPCLIFVLRPGTADQVGKHEIKCKIVCTVLD